MVLTPLGRDIPLRRRALGALLFTIQAGRIRSVKQSVDGREWSREIIIIKQSALQRIGRGLIRDKKKHEQ